MLVSDEISLTEGIYNLAILREIGVTALLRLRICFGAILLLLHEAAETIFINFKTGF